MNQSGKSPGATGFIAVAFAVVGVLLAGYIVFIALKMARSVPSRENLLALALALAGAVLAGVLGSIHRRG